jgi:hypothetical protein
MHQNVFVPPPGLPHPRISLFLNAGVLATNRVPHLLSFLYLALTDRDLLLHGRASRRN